MVSWWHCSRALEALKEFLKLRPKRPKRPPPGPPARHRSAARAPARRAAAPLRHLRAPPRRVRRDPPARHRARRDEDGGSCDLVGLPVVTLDPSGPVVANPDGNPGTIRVGHAFDIAHFTGNCCCCEYWQEIKGYALVRRRGSGVWSDIGMVIGRGAELDRNNFQEDGKPWFLYRHRRGRVNIPEDSYLPVRGAGCEYKGKRLSPSVVGSTLGDSVDLHLTFHGSIIDICTGTLNVERTWRIHCYGTVDLEMSFPYSTSRYKFRAISRRRRPGHGSSQAHPPQWAIARRRRHADGGLARPPPLPPWQFLTDVRTNCPALWENNPHLTAIDAEDPIRGDRPQRISADPPEQSRALSFHPWLYALSQRAAEPADRASEFKGDIYLSRLERSWMSCAGDHAAGAALLARRLRRKNSTTPWRNGGIRRVIRPWSMPMRAGCCSCRSAKYITITRRSEASSIWSGVATCASSSASSTTPPVS